MEPNGSTAPRKPGGLGRALIWWPATLALLTLMLLFVAGRVSAWHGRGERGPDAWRAHAARMLDRVLDEIDASDAQAERIRTIADSAFAELAAARAADPAAGGADALRALVTAESVDRGALEALRSAHVERAAALSAIAATRLADALEVLTPAQRVTLVDTLDDFRAHHRRHHDPRDHAPHGRGHDPDGGARYRAGEPDAGA